MLLAGTGCHFHWNVNQRSGEGHSPRGLPQLRRSRQREGRTLPEGERNRGHTSRAGVLNLAFTIVRTSEKAERTSQREN